MYKRYEEQYLEAMRDVIENGYRDEGRNLKIMSNSISTIGHQSIISF